MLLLSWRHQFRISGSGKPLICICLYIHCQFSGVTSPPSERITDPPLHEPTLQHSSRDNPLTNPYKKPLAKRSPAPVASTAFASPIAGTRTIYHRRKFQFACLQLCIIMTKRSKKKSNDNDIHRGKASSCISNQDIYRQRGEFGHTFQVEIGN